MNSFSNPVIWFTGMSGSGKTTLALVLKEFLLLKRQKVYILDGDDIRNKYGNRLGFGYEDVLENNIRIANLCNQYRKEYDVIIVPVISPYGGIRSHVRKILEPNFHLVYLRADIASLRIRDTKGLYLSADKGLINDLIGYSRHNPYEEPNDAELIIDTGIDSDKDKSISYLIDYFYQ